MSGDFPSKAANLAGVDPRPAESAPMHYAPPVKQGLHPQERDRRALCGVVYSVGGERVAGSSRLEFTTCCACLDVIDARKRIAEAGDQCTKEET